MNRIVEHHYQNEMMYRWFEQFVDVTPHDGSTHPIKMITVDGIANLPIVTEGGSYTEAVGRRREGGNGLLEAGFLRGHHD